MFLTLYLSGAAVHFVMNFMLYEAAVRRKELSRDRATSASASKEVTFYSDTMINFLWWPVDISQRLWKLLKSKD